MVVIIQTKESIESQLSSLDFDKRKSLVSSLQINTAEEISYTADIVRRLQSSIDDDNVIVNSYRIRLATIADEDKYIIARLHELNNEIDYLDSRGLNSFYERAERGNVIQRFQILDKQYADLENLPERIQVNRSELRRLDTRLREIEAYLEILNALYISYAGYVQINGRFRISSEIDDFVMFVTARGDLYNYKALASTALNIYFQGIVEIETGETFIKFASIDDLPDWARGTLNSGINSYFQDAIAVFDMNQLFPTGRVKEISAMSGKHYARGIRRGAKRFINFETGEYGYV